MDVAVAMGTSDWDLFPPKNRKSICSQVHLLEAEGVCLLICFHQTVLNITQISWPPPRLS